VSEAPVRLTVLTVALTVTAAALAGGQPGRFKSGVDLVNVAVMVMDRQGNFITDLKADDFVVFEDGKKQDVRYFLRGDSEADALNLRLGLLLDTSGSMQEDIGLARTAAIRFLKELPEANDITLVDFDTEVRVARYGVADLPRLIERIRSRKPDGWTALYDALGIYLDGACEMDGRKVLVLYTDGGDTRSAQTFTDIMDMLKASDVIVYAIGFLEHQATGVRSEQKMRLQQIADSTGGQSFFPTSTKALDPVFQQIARQVRAQYSLGFVSSNTLQDGTWRRVDVRLMPAHLQSLRLRTRRGYYAPLKDVVPADTLAGRPRSR
jgi:Ca-activated chloride channel family protein